MALCDGEENDIFIFLKCEEARRQREQFLIDKWLYMDE
jgi:hypothetical protein